MKHHPKSAHKAQSIVVYKNPKEAKIYFRPKDFDPSHDDVLATVNALIASSQCTGADLARLRSGEVRLYFNVLWQKKSNREFAVEKVVEVIKKN